VLDDREGIVATRTRKRLVIAAGAVLTVVLTALGVLSLLPADEPAAPATAPARHLSATDVTNQFLDAFTAGRADEAAALTDDPTAAATQLAEVWRALTPASVEASRTELVAPPAGATVAGERYTLTWELGAGHSWAYESGLRLVRKDADWLVRWQPTLVHPRLSAGLHLTRHDPAGQPAVLGRGGAPLLTWTDAGPAATDPAFAPLLLPAMGRVASGRGGADGWYVALADAKGKERAVLLGSRAKALTSTLSGPVQQAAQAAVDTQRFATLLVALQPSTGDILAVAQNAVAGSEPRALNGLYPPGSTFKIATATAIIEAGEADVNTVVPCPRSAVVGQRTVHNANFELGDVPLRTAFAKSCNTTFAMQAATLPPDALPRAASQLGLAADFTIPGITTEAGGMRAATNTAEQVENSIGQGSVQVSCFGLALVAATVAAGHATTPRLWRDLPTTVGTGYQAPPEAVIGSLRTMMREVVTAGRGSALAGYGQVYGKTGTAQVGDGTSAHGWFAGYRDDLAFATVVLDGSSSTAAIAVSGRFLSAAGR
jgi:hypothetical protein